ncbi:MAG: metal-dependent hydrolase [Akkermansiaceae bacterium]
MTTIAHALLPVVIAGSLLPLAKLEKKKTLIAIALTGAAPDLLNPHLSLEARLTSWSHGIPFWLLLTAVLILWSCFSKRKFSLKLALAMSSAYLLHIACDAISGGVNFLYPFKDLVWGVRWVKFALWIPLDVCLIILCYMMFRVIPRYKNKSLAK